MLRSTLANRALIVATREKLEWTQERLTLEAGLSVRVVAKAEGGGSVSSETLRRIAEAFGGSGHGLSVKDLANDSVRLLASLVRQYRHGGERSQAMFRESIAQDVVTLVDGEISWLPIADEHRGIGAFNSAWKSLFGLYEPSPAGLAADGRLLATHEKAITWGREGITAQSAERCSPCLMVIRIELKHSLVSQSQFHVDTLRLHIRLQKR